MVTLIEQMAKEINSNSPNATSDMISRYLINLFEQEVIPASFENVHLPRQLSRAENIKTRFLIKRARARIRKKYQNQIKRNEVIKEFEGVKNYFKSFVASDNTIGLRNSEILDNSTGLRNISLIGASYPFVNATFGDGDPTGRSKKEIYSSKELQQMVPYNVFQSKEKAVSFIFDRKTYDLISRDHVFSKKVGIVESASRLFVLSKGIEASMLFSLQMDIETPNLEKFILTIRVPNLDFDKKMEFWDELDYFIRKQIQDRIRLSNSEEKEELRDFNKNLFTDFPLED